MFDVFPFPRGDFQVPWWNFEGVSMLKEIDPDAGSNPLCKWFWNGF